MFSHSRPQQPDISELNRELTAKLTKKFEADKARLSNIKSSHPAIRESLKLFSEFNMQQFEARLRKDLKDRLIPAWLENQKEDAVGSYQCIYFEYSDQETPPYEAFSYGLYNIRNYKLTTERHYFEYADHRGWAAGSGILLEPFMICKPFDIQVLSEEEFENVHNDRNSGIQEIWNAADSMTKVVLNKVFSEADAAGLFSKLKLARGGMFMYAVHDDGNVQDPFYFKK
ncbi:MAG TPA: hypothetical protein VFE50_11235 [Cyclobacteriaceae bacterium]|nr:hypothetical protein [Cyclobacteriaceae bacterium]